jgi:hypothetical protein
LNLDSVLLNFIDLCSDSLLVFNGAINALASQQAQMSAGVLSIVTAPTVLINGTTMYLSGNTLQNSAYTTMGSTLIVPNAGINQISGLTSIMSSGLNITVGQTAGFFVTDGNGMQLNMK